jgi:RNA recognition motif-containing protein
VKIVEHTNLGREDAILPKVLRDEKKQREQEKEKVEAEKRAYEEKNATKIKKQEKKKAKKEAKKKEEKKQLAETVESETLFVRNIGFEIDEAKFKEFMNKFGPVKYAVLCKAHVY